MWCTVVHVPDSAVLPDPCSPQRMLLPGWGCAFSAAQKRSFSLSFLSRLAHKPLCYELSQLKLSVPADLRKAQAQRVWFSLLEGKEWNKGRIWALSPTHSSEGEGRMQSQAHYLPPAPISRLQETEQKYLAIKSQGVSLKSCFQDAPPPHHPWKQTSNSDQFIIPDSPPTAAAKVKGDSISQVLH